MHVLKVLGRPPLYNTILPKMDPTLWTQGTELKRDSSSLSLSLSKKKKKKRKGCGDLGKMKILYKYVGTLYTDIYYKYEHSVNILGHLDKEKTISLLIWRQLTHV